MPSRLVLCLALLASGCVRAWSLPQPPAAPGATAVEWLELDRVRLRHRARASVARAPREVDPPSGLAATLAGPASAFASWQVVLPSDTQLLRVGDAWHLDAPSRDGPDLGSLMVLSLAPSEIDGGLTALAVVGWILLGAATAVGGTFGGLLFLCATGGCSTG